MGQSSSGAGATNTLTLTLQSNVGVQTVEDGSLTGRVTITGLRGFTNSNGAIPLTNKGFTDVTQLVVGGSAQWSRGDATLVLELAPGKQLQAGTVYVLAFSMRNPNIAQASPAISIEVSGLQNVQVQRVAVEKATGTAAPLLVSRPEFWTAAIGQRSSGPDVTNQVTVTLAANLRLSESMRVTISGLLRSGTSDNTGLTLTNCDGVFKSPAGLENKARWTQSTGSLELLVANGLEEGVEVVCVFELTNPRQEQEAADVSISVNSFASGQVTNIIPSTAMRKAPGNAGPFFVRRSTFLTATIGQSKPYPGEDSNRISVTLRANVAIASVGSVVATITLSGLTGSRTEDTSQLIVNGEDPNWNQITRSRAAWTQESGTLVLTIASQQNLRANRNYAFSFDLANPFEAQDSPAVSISTAGGERIPAMAMSTSTSGCIHQEGDTAPLFVYTRAFLTKRIGYKTTTRQAVNIVSVTIRSSVSLSSIIGSQTSITISGLLGLATPDNNALPITSSDMNVLGDSAEWRRETGTLIFRIQTGRTMDSSVEYHLDVEVTNGVDVISLTPMITASSISTIIPDTRMDFEGVDRPPVFSVSSEVGGEIVSSRLSFKTTAQILSGDQLIILLPGFAGPSTSSGNQIWGVASSPSAFTVEADRFSYQDRIAGGSSVASAQFRAGFVGRTPRASSDADGETGSTIAMDASDLRLFGKANVVSGRMISIDGSAGYHHIFRQTPAAVAQEGVAHFFPKYAYGSADAEQVPKGATYTILPQLELTARSSICSGTNVVIEIPSSAGLRIPAGGIADGAEVWLSHVKAGTARTATIGTLSTIDNANAQYSGTSGREVEMRLEEGFSGDYEGFPLQSTTAAVPGFVFVDGFRLISVWDSSTSTAKLFTGFGPKKTTSLKVGVTHGTLQQRKSLSTSLADVWLQLAEVSAVRPQLTQANEGSFLQIGEEIVRFTGDLAKGVASFTNPETVGGPCRVSADGAACLTAGNCLLLEFEGCEDQPTTTINMVAGAIDSLSVNYGGACKAGQTPRVRGDIRQADGVVCDVAPRCGTGCVAALVSGNNMIKAQRAQLGTSATALAASALAPSTARVQPVSMYLDNGKVKDLLYTSSEKELDRSNQQTLRIRYNRNAHSLSAGDHVTAISNPATVGAGCRKGGVMCGELDVCATIVFNGCPVNPKARLQFNGGQINGVLSIGTSTTFGGSLCRPEDALTGVIALANDVVCDIPPNCGTQCQPTLDATQDLILVRHANMQNSVGVYPNGEEDYSVNDDVVRVHTSTEGTGYRIVLVPPTRLLVETDTASSCDDAGAIRADATCSEGQATQLLDDAGNVLAEFEAADCQETVCAGMSFATTPSGARVTYPVSCLQSCNVTGLGGFAIASDKVIVEVQSLAAPGSPVFRLVLAIIYNVGSESRNASRRLLNAPAGFEYRVNGDCDCPASISGSAECDVDESGEYQVLLIPLSHCPAGPIATFPPPEPETTAMGGDGSVSMPVTTPALDDDENSDDDTDYGPLVGGVVGGLLGAFFIATIIYLICRRAPGNATDEKGALADSEAAEEGKMASEERKPEKAAAQFEEGPVFVGRPVPLPPDPLLSSPRFSSSPVFAPNPAWTLNHSVIQPLPTSYTPGFPVPLLPHRPVSPTLRVISGPVEPAVAVAPPVLQPVARTSPALSPGAFIVPAQQPRYRVGEGVGPRQPQAELDEPPPVHPPLYASSTRRPYQVVSDDVGEDADEAGGTSLSQPLTPTGGRVPYGV